MAKRMMIESYSKKFKRKKGLKYDFKVLGLDTRRTQMLLTQMGEASLEALMFCFACVSALFSRKERHLKVIIGKF